APLTFEATNANAANRLFYEADVTLPQSGPWTVAVDVTGPAGSGSASFDIEVGEADGPNWFLWGGGAVLALAGLFFLAGRFRN
ncbi:MAG: LPXTG cell wall anchor domain-containing protein, partial [Anaerolineae bacterium]|nr:LPXTG cell wall anchor domain-containing protein [Anaerolineae bacterium]